MMLQPGISPVAASAGAFGWGTITVFGEIVHLFERAGKPPLFSLDPAALMVRRLLAWPVVLSAVGLHELSTWQLECAGVA